MIRSPGDKKSGDKKSGDKKSGDKKSGDKKSGDKKSDHLSGVLMGAICSTKIYPSFCQMIKYARIVC